MSPDDSVVEEVPAYGMEHMGGTAASICRTGAGHDCYEGAGVQYSATVSRLFVGAIRLPHRSHPHQCFIHDGKLTFVLVA